MMPSSETNDSWRLGHRPALDGIRATAVGLVLLAHSRIPLVGNGGGVGVAIFFTLSGFLITALLLEERQAFGRIKVTAFYLRRALRLVPAMVACVALAMVVMLGTEGHIPDWSLVIGTLTYTSNWVMIDGHFPLPTALGHTWSLAIEEQFYLIWPLALILLGRVTPRRTVRLILIAAAGVLLLRALLHNGADPDYRLYFGFDTRADGLLIGAALAFWLHRRPERTVHAATPWVGLGALAACCFAWGWAKWVLMPTVVGLGTALLIYGVVQRRGFRLFEMRPVRWVGKRSYGIYLYQSPLHVLEMHLLGLSPAWWLLVFLPATFVAAALSWRYVEQPFLRWKDRDPRSHAAVSERLSGGGDGPDRIDQRLPGHTGGGV